MSRVKYIAAAVGAAFVVWGVAFRHLNPPAQVEVPTMAERWEEVPVSTAPRVIPIVKVIPDAVPAAEPQEEQEPPIAKSFQRKVKAKQHRSDVCGAHRMRKVYVSKHRWRCRR